MGGYCLPTDTKQLKSNFEKLPETLISAVTASNEVRKQFIVQRIVTWLNDRKNNVMLGACRLIMKSESDNFRSSAIIDVVDSLLELGINVIVYESFSNHINDDINYTFIDKLQSVLDNSDMIIANRFDQCLSDVIEKVYTCDIFVRD